MVVRVREAEHEAGAVTSIADAAETGLGETARRLTERVMSKINKLLSGESDADDDDAELENLISSLRQFQPIISKYLSLRKKLRNGQRLLDDYHTDLLAQKSRLLGGADLSGLAGLGIAPEIADTSSIAESTMSSLPSAPSPRFSPQSSAQGQPSPLARLLSTVFSPLRLEDVPPVETTMAPWIGAPPPPPPDTPAPKASPKIISMPS